MKIWVWCITTLLVSVSSLTAQVKNCGLEVKGQILDLDSKSPVSGAYVSIEGTASNSISDEFGHFNLPELCRGKILLLVQSNQHASLKIELAIRGDTTISVSLNNQSISLEEIQVTATRKSVPGANTSATLDKRQLEQAGGGTLAGILQNVAGVNSIQTGSTIGKPVIQGLHSNRILLLNNGIRQEGQQWGMEHSPEIDPFVAGQITVIKGAEGVRFGPEALGGVVLVEPAPLPKESRMNGELTLATSTNGRSGIVSGRLDGGLKNLSGFGWRLQGTNKRSGNTHTGRYYLENTGVRESNYSGALGYSRESITTEVYFSHFKTELGIFGGSHIGSVQDLQARIINGRPFTEGQFSYSIDAPRQVVEHNLLKLKAHVHLKNSTHLDFLYGFQQNERQEYDTRRGGRSSIPSLDLALNTHTLDLHVESTTPKGWKNTIGLNGLLQVNNNVPGTLAAPLIPNYDTYSAGAYVISRLLKRNYELEAGIRFDHKNLDALGYDQDQQLYGGSHQFNNISATFGAVFHLTGNWLIRSNLGSAWRPPAVNELYSKGLHHGSAAFESGNPDLSSERSYKWITSTEYNSEKVAINLSLFLNHISNYIYLKPSQELYESIRGVFPTFDYQQTDARLAGSDLNITYKINRFLNYDIKASRVRAKDVQNNSYLPLIPSDRLENSISWQTQERTKTRSKGYVSLSHLFVARQNRYEANSDYASPPASYHLFNATAGISFKLKDKRLAFNTSINNISNKLYKEYMNRFRYYAHDQGRNLTARVILEF